MIYVRLGAIIGNVCDKMLIAVDLGVWRMLVEPNIAEETPIVSGM